MSLMDDVDLARDGEMPAQAPSRGPGWLVPAVALAVFCGLLLTLWIYRSRQEKAPVQTAAGPAAPSAPPHAVAPEPPTTLPALADLDAFARGLVSPLLKTAIGQSWLTTDHLAEQFTAIVQGVAEGRAPTRMLGRFRPSAPFRVITKGDRTVIDPQTYARYDVIADAVGGLDPAAAAQAYKTLLPRLNEAYAQLGIQDATLDAALQRALVVLLSTPVPSGDVAVVPSGGTYVFADPTLEALTPAQKLLIRTGPANARRIQTQLAALATALGIPVTLPLAK